MGPPCKQRNRLVDQQEQEESTTTVSNSWNPVDWYTRNGYNVSDMINAPGKPLAYTPVHMYSLMDGFSIQDSHG